MIGRVENRFLNHAKILAPRGPKLASQALYFASTLSKKEANIKEIKRKRSFDRGMLVILFGTAITCFLLKDYWLAGLFVIPIIGFFSLMYGTGKELDELGVLK